MIDFHIVLSPGAEGGLTVASALHYAALAGIRFAGLVIPSDGSNFSCIKTLAEQVRRYSLYANVEACLGVELRHLPPALIPAAIQEARNAGCSLVMVYGETLCDQVETGTNFAAIEGRADVLVHPGLIDAEAAALAAEKHVALEFTSCPRHALTNAHVASMALRFGCALVRGSAATCASELTTRTVWPLIIRGADVFGHKDNKSNLFELLKKSEENMIRELLLEQKEAKKN